MTTEIVVPDQAFVERLLEEMGLEYGLDEDGDLGAPWEHFRMYFVFRGADEGRTFAVRTFYDRRHAIEAKPHLLELLDDWNRRTLWPKVYSHTGDDGAVTLIGEAMMLIGAGVTVEHFVTTTATWIHASVEFDTWLVEQHRLLTDET
ncbi:MULTISPECIES: type III secretion system chaperone family protein [Amycolatopsis]|uniref:Putative sensory transduction regulator n=1 Tax=Amycolatopsis thermoflava TaxID=84480 RepID=A0A3N2GRY6_9PSEU|nr:YbjN domain-containing protein [Amycolatopsis thermoflava]ROS39357.1 putative sensory transduction regulator [Amycolatopsis thermoflava]